MVSESFQKRIAAANLRLQSQRPILPCNPGCYSIHEPGQIRGRTHPSSAGFDVGPNMGAIIAPSAVAKSEALTAQKRDPTHP